MNLKDAISFFKNRRNKNQNFVEQVGQYDDNGFLIAIYESTRLAEKATGIDRRQIGDCCLGKQLHSHGYVWKYL